MSLTTALCWLPCSFATAAEPATVSLRATMYLPVVVVAEPAAASPTTTSETDHRERYAADYEPSPHGKRSHGASGGSVRFAMSSSGLLRRTLSDPRVSVRMDIPVSTTTVNRKVSWTRRALRHQSATLSVAGWNLQ